MENLQPTFPQPSDTACLQATHPQRAPAQVGSSELTQHQALWCLWTWLGTEPGGQQGFSVWLQTQQCPRRGLSDPCWLYPQRRAAHSLGLPTHTHRTLTCKLHKPPHPQRICCTSVIFIYGLFISGRKEKSHSKSKQPLLQQLLRTQLHCRKLNLPRYKDVFLNKTSSNHMNYNRVYSM